MWTMTLRRFVTSPVSVAKSLLKLSDAAPADPLQHEVLASGQVREFLEPHGRQRCSDPPGARRADHQLVQLQDDRAHGGQVSAVEQFALSPLDIDDEQRRPSELDNLAKRSYGNLDRTDFAARA